MKTLTLPVMAVQSSVRRGIRAMEATGVNGIIAFKRNSYHLLRGQDVIEAAKSGATRLSDVTPMGTVLAPYALREKSVGFISPGYRGWLRTIGAGESSNQPFRFTVLPIEGAQAVVSVPHGIVYTMLTMGRGYYCTGPQRHSFSPPPRREPGEQCPYCEGTLVPVEF